MAAADFVTPACEGSVFQRPHDGTVKEEVFPDEARIPFGIFKGVADVRCHECSVMGKFDVLLAGVAEIVLVVERAFRIDFRDRFDQGPRFGPGPLGAIRGLIQKPVAVVFSS